MERHIVASKIFTDLTSKLTKEHFIVAGHTPLCIVFGDKNKAEEAVSPNKEYLSMKMGYNICRNSRRQVRVSGRTQIIRTVDIAPIYFDDDSDFNGLFEELQSIAPKHFNNNDPVRIKVLTTKHLKTGTVCKWEKVKIMVADKKEEWRLMLTEINGLPASFSNTDAEDIAAGMMETVCDTVEQPVISRNVCSMIANK